MLVEACSPKNKDNETNKVAHQTLKTIGTVFTLADTSILKMDVIRNFVYQDSIYWGHPVFLKNLKTNVLINAPTFLWQANKNKTMYLIYPGEEIKVNIGEDKGLVFSIANNQERTNELDFFRILIKKFGPIYNYVPALPYHLPAGNLKEMNVSEQAIYDNKKRRLQFLDDYADKRPISKNFFTIAQTTIGYSALKDSLLLFWSHKDLLKKQQLYQPLLAEKLKAINEGQFHPFLIYFNACSTILSMSTSEYIAYDMTTTEDFLKNFTFIQDNFTGLNKDFLMANCLYSACKESIAVPEAYIHQFYSTCKDEGYKRIIRNKLNEKKSIMYAKDANSLMSADGKTIRDLEQVCEDYKGKLILIDLWASWCSPCRAEMPFSEELQKYYAGKQIAFIYLSTDESKADWLKAAAEENLSSSASFLLLNGVKSSFAKENDIKTIPRYLLIGKDGKIINADAPRPSDNKLKAIIEKHIN